MSDPFRHHPSLRGLVQDADRSFFRNIDLPEFARKLEAQGLATDWWLSPEEREADRLATMNMLSPEADLWVFGYGSLMWDPGLQFDEVRRARAAGYARRFILKDIHGGRGTRDRPGLILALDSQEGATCDGLIFRIPPGLRNAETRQLWNRERIGGAYHSAWIDVETAIGTVRALTFVADHEAELIDADISFEEQVDCAAFGQGILGTSLDYLRGVLGHLDEFGIHDAELAALLAAAEERARTA